MHFRNSLTNNIWHCVVHSHWCLFPLLRFSYDHAQPFLQYLWNFGLEVQSYSLKESCLPPVRPAVNHYLAQVALPICVWFTIYIGLVRYTMASFTLWVSDRDNLVHKISVMQNPKQQIWILKDTTLPCFLPKVCLKTGNNFWIPPTAQHHKDFEV